MKIMSLSEKGDTIVEVLIATSIIGMIVVAGFTGVNTDQSVELQTQERGGALQLVQSQIELLRALVGNESVTLGTPPANNDFCLESSAPAPGVISTTPGQSSTCNFNSSNQPSNSSVPNYHIYISDTSPLADWTQIQVTAQWYKAGGAGTDSTSLDYRFYPNDVAAKVPLVPGYGSTAPVCGNVSLAGSGLSDTGGAYSFSGGGSHTATATFQFNNVDRGPWTASGLSSSSFSPAAGNLQNVSSGSTLIGQANFNLTTPPVGTGTTTFYFWVTAWNTYCRGSITVDASPPPGSQTFLANSTCTEQTLTVPSGVTSVNIEAVGGQGGTGQANGGFNSSNIPGGFGGVVNADVPVHPGDTLNVYVGEHGNYLGGCGYHQGGNGSWAGGGGSSAVLDGSVEVVEAGGGGGSGYCNSGGSAYCATGVGGAGGNPNGTDGGSGWVSYYFASGGAYGGTGASQSSDGTGGTYIASNSGQSGSNGSNGTGGNGGSTTNAYGGGGGGGYKGGGGGGAAFFSDAASGGGGGGSSWATSSATSFSYSTSSQSDGYVKISW
jgi:hypothetical protein